MTWLRRIALALLLAAGPAGAQEPRLTSDVASTDWARAVDVVILSEGYVRAEEQQFLADARRLAEAIRVDPDAAPLRAGPPINLHFVFVPGRDRGAPWQAGRPARRTPFGAHVTPEGDFDADDAEADAVAAEVAPDVDVVVVLARLTPADEPIPASARRRWARAEGDDLDLPEDPDDVRPNADVPTDGARIRTTTLDPEAFLHELGHALYGLGDEYEEYPGAPPEDERWEVAVCPNLTLERTGRRWKDIVDTAYEGGGMWKEGVWRPERRCRMRESRADAFCLVCQDVIRGGREADAPGAPEWTRPADDAVVFLPPGQRRLKLEPRWRHRGDAPVSFHLDLRRISPDGRRRQVWWDAVEGHARRTTFEVGVQKAGTYALGISAVNLAGESEVVWTTFTVRPGGATSGLVGALGDATD